MKFRRSVACVLFGLVLASVGAFAQGIAKPDAKLAQAIHEADDFIRSNKPADAYARLLPFEFEGSGDLRFDYLFGIAALDSGKSDKATLAFERVLAVDPNFAGARLDLARAYYQLGDLLRAKTEFENVLKQSPPDAARLTIQIYLGLIASYQQSQNTRVAGYAEGVLGYDNNIANSSTQAFTFAPNSPWSGLFPGDQLPSSTRLKGSYEGINAGFEVHHKLHTNWGVFGAADLRQHGNQFETDYNSTNLDARFGVLLDDQQDVYKVSVTRAYNNSAGTLRRNSTGVGFEWQHAPNPADQISAFVQYGRNRASGFAASSPATDARIEGDTNQWVLGTGWVHILADPAQAVFGSIYWGRELDVAPLISPGLPDGGRADGQKLFDGLRVGAQTSIAGQLDGIASLGWQLANYGKLNSLIMANRSERIYDLTLGLAWRPDKLWTVKPQLAFSRKSSNVALYSFDRTDASLTIRRDFK